MINSFLQVNSIVVKVPGVTQGVDSSGHRLGAHSRILPPHKGLNRIKELPILPIYLLALPPEWSVWSTVRWRAPKLGLCGLRPKCSSAHPSITLLSPLLGSRPAQGHSLKATWGLVFLAVIFPFFCYLISSSISVPWILLIFVDLLTPLIALLFPCLLSFLTL